jgi:hypothetical protein
MPRCSPSGRPCRWSTASWLSTNSTRRHKSRIDTSVNPLAKNDVINFNLGDGTQTIAVAGSALPTVTSAVKIDGTAPVGNPTQVVVIDGTSFQNAKMAGINGLTLAVPNATVDNLQVQNFTGNGIEVDAPAGKMPPPSKDILLGDTLAGNGNYGLLIQNSQANSIGYDGKNILGNTISQNGAGGVKVNGSNAKGNILAGNTISNNTGIGVLLSDHSSGTSVGSAEITGSGNTIVGNRSYGLDIDESSGNVVAGNSIGIHLVNGFTDGLISGNGLDGIILKGGGAASNVIGAQDAPNIISANGGNGIRILQGPNNFIDGNFIGTNLSGNDVFDGKGAVTGNKLDGVLLDDAPNNQVGVNSPNIISGNKGNGIEVKGSAPGNGTGNKIENNIIGGSNSYDQNNKTRIPLENAQNAVLVTGADKTTVTGNSYFVAPGQNAIKAKNARDFTEKGNSPLQAPPPDTNTPDAPDTQLFNVSGATIGGPLAGDGNVFAAGVSILASSNVTVQGNSIGVDAQGNSFGNAGNGITIDQLSSNVLIGGSAARDANTIEDNGGAGVSVVSGSGVQISQNVIAGNAALGIDLSGNGVTLNHAGGPTSGPNGLLNFPVLTSVVLNGSTVTINGTYNGAANTSYAVEFFDDAQSDASGYGQGQVYLGTTNVTTDANGNATFSVTFAVPAGWAGPHVSATATDPSGNTSEFSRTATAYAPGTIGGDIWNDVNGNGILDPYEAGLSGVTVNLFNAGNNALVASTTSAGDGSYTFANQAAGSYFVQVVAPSGYQFSPRNAGADSTTNSLADPSTGDTPTFTLAAGSVVADVNAGLSSSRPAPTVSLTGPSTASVYGQPVTFTATVSAASGTPTGTVTFFDGSTPLGTTVLNATGAATFTTSWLAPGTHNVQASYNGDANDAPATSAVVAQTVNQDASTVALVSSTSPSSLGAAVTFTATVSAAAPGAGLPTGTVTFSDGGTVLGTVTLDHTGTAAFTTSGLGLGSQGITATYNGDANFLASSADVIQQVNQATSVTLTGPGASVVAGQPFTLTAVVSASSGTPTGDVTFLADGYMDLGDVAVDDTGTATLSAALYDTGNHSIVAIYDGDANYGTSTSNAISQQVNQAGTSTALTSSGSPSLAGQPVTFTATIGVSSPGAGLPSGSVTFEDGSTVLGVVSVDDTGMATFTTSALAQGSHTITASYRGNSDLLASSASLVQVISQETSTWTSLASSASPALPGQAVTFTATVGAMGGTPTGSVTFLDGSTVLGTASLNANGKAVFSTSALSLGSQSITAIYGGDSTFASSSASLSQVVNQGSTTMTLSSSAGSSPPNQPVTFTATIMAMGSGTPTGSVTFLDGTTVLGTGTLSVVNGQAQAAFTTSSLGLGNHDVIAVYSGDNTFAESKASLNQTISLRATQTSLTSSANPAQPGQAVTFTATVMGMGSGTPTGTVTFMDGTTVLGTGTLTVVNGQAEATFTTSNLGLVSHNVIAVYSGDSSFAESDAAVIQSVTLAGTTTSLTSSADPSQAGQAVTFTVTIGGANPSLGTPTGTVTFMDGTTVLGTAIISVINGQAEATFTIASLGLGSHNIVALYSGDGTYAESVASLMQTVSS